MFRAANGTAPLCVGYSEFDKYAVQIYQSHFPEHKNYGDITKINAEELPDFDLICGGFPCQSFSIAGKRGGFADTRGTLFFDIARIVKVKRPRLLLLENVKGLLSHDEGRTFATIIATLDELGYDIQWQVLNSKNHGVPQNRERVYIVGHLRGTARPKVFPFTKDDRLDTRNNEEPATQIAPALRASGSPKSDGQYVGCVKKDNVISSRKIANTIDANYYKGLDAHQARTGVTNGVQIRRLTPIECERLQGFPDNWTEKVSDTQRYKTLGNAVTVNVVKAVAEHIL